MAYANLVGDGSGGGSVVAGDDMDADPGSVGAGDGVGDAGAGGVEHRH
jgi:hypothetical protein